MISLELIREWAAVITAAAVLISAIGALLLYYQTKKGIAQREALKIVRDQIGDRDWIEDYEAWETLRSHLARDQTGTVVPNFDLAQSLTPYATSSDSGGIGEDFRTRRSLLVRRLNRYEMIAVGIRTGSIDEDVIRLWWAGPLVREFIDHRFFVQVARQHNTKVFREFHWLAHRFASAEDRTTIEMVVGSPFERSTEATKVILAIERMVSHWKWVLAAILLAVSFWIGSISQ